MWTPCYSVKQAGFLVPLVPGMYKKNHSTNPDTVMHLAQDCLAPLTNSTTGHYNSTGTHSTSLWLAFLNSV